MIVISIGLISCNPTKKAQQETTTQTDPETEVTSEIKSRTPWTCDSCGIYTDRAICINDICKSYRIKNLLKPTGIDVNKTPVQMVVTSPYVEADKIKTVNYHIIHNPFQLGENNYHKVNINDTISIRLKGSSGSYGIYWFLDSDTAFVNPLNDDIGHGSEVKIKMKK